MKINKIREMSSPDLEKELGELKSELFKLRFSLATNGLDNPMKIKEVKRDIAKIKTVLTQRELNGEEVVKADPELAKAMGIPFEQDYVAINLDILSDLPPETTTSMQRDVMAHKPSELEGLVFEVVRMGQKYHVPVPMYEKVAEKLKALI